jgi:hypothetical protein
VEGIELTKQQTRDLLEGFENSGRKMMDWLEDTVIDWRNVQSKIPNTLSVKRAL